MVNGIIVTKLFYSSLTARAFVLDKRSQPSLMFTSEAGAYLSETPFKRYILG
jgi:hypothetical protein